MTYYILVNQTLEVQLVQLVMQAPCGYQRTEVSSIVCSVAARARSVAVRACSVAAPACKPVAVRSAAVAERSKHAVLHIFSA